MSVTEQSGGGGSTGHPNVSNDERFEVLSNHRRRYALHYLQRNGDRATLGELADQVAAWENGIDTDSVSYDERKRVYTSLQQIHLPRMDETGVVEFDDRDGVVQLGPTAHEVDVYLEIVAGNDVPWSKFYVGLAILNAGLVAGAGLGFFPVIPDVGWAIFVLVTFLVTALAHLYVTRTEMKLGETGREG